MKKILYVILGLFITGFLILPNVMNSRERHAFSEKARVEGAKELFKQAGGADSVTLPLSDFYDRGAFVRDLLGSEYRDTWKTPVTFPVWKEGPSFRFGDLGGGDQTTSLDITSSDQRNYTLRSVNKDQSRALPSFLRPTLARPLFRDQASSLNPYAAPVVAKLSAYAGIPHMLPQLFYIPYDPVQNDAVNNTIAGRVMLMEEEADESWNFSDRFGPTSRVLSTSRMVQLVREDNYKPDTLMFARCRIFDILIGDWDRHEKQWKWACDTVSKICTPLPVDRDMAFYDFSGGYIDAVALSVAPKLQSFDIHMKNLDGYVRNGKEFQQGLLKNVSRQQWLEQAGILRDSLTINRLRNAFREYPKAIADKHAENHTTIFQERLDRADSIAGFLYETMR